MILVPTSFLRPSFIYINTNQGGENIKFTKQTTMRKNGIGLQVELLQQLKLAYLQIWPQGHILIMRKLNTKVTPGQSRFPTEPVSQVLQRKSIYESPFSLSKLGNLEMFHDQLLLKQKRLMTNIRRTESTTKDEQSNQQIRRKSLHDDFSKATQALNEMRRELSHKKSQVQEDRQYDKLNRVIDSLQISLGQKTYEKIMRINQPPAPVYYPVPMPLPMYNQNSGLPYINQAKTRNQLQFTNSSFNSKYKSTNYQRSYMNHGQGKGGRLRKNKRKFKKAVNAILFTVYLKDFCKKMRQSRKVTFNKIQSSFQPSLRQMAEGLKKSLKPFYSLLFMKREVNYDIEQNQSSSVIKGKVDSIRKFIQMVLQAAKKWMEVGSANKKYMEVFYHLCRHGNYSCTRPFLTLDQLQLTCISPKFSFVSADQNLQNSAFINLYFIKLLLYNLLLSPQKISPQFQDQILSTNLYLISSVLYQLVIELQDQFMIRVSKIYEIGNFNSVPGVQSSPPLIYTNGLKTEGDLISGLKDQECTRKYFELQSWDTQKTLLKQTIDIFHKQMAKYHTSISERYY